MLSLAPVQCLVFWLFSGMSGALAGLWATIMASNAMGGQEFKKHMTKVREFCKSKNLPWPVRERLLAHYRHLYPDQVRASRLCLCLPIRVH